MAHVHVSIGDVVEVYGVGQFVVESGVEMDQGGARIVPRMSLCKGCEENEVDEIENMPYCPRCLMDAQLWAALNRIVNEIGDEDVPVARVIEWDEQNMRRAQIAGEQYIDLESAAMDWISGMSPDEFRDEFVSFISRHLPEYMRDAIASKLA